MTEHVVEHWGRPEPDSLERQYEFAEDHGIVQLHEWMRGEAVRQVQEILGIETDPEMWYFFARNAGPADQYHIILMIDGLEVYLNNKGRLYAEKPLSKTTRLRSYADFEEALQSAEITDRLRREADQYPG